MRNNLPYTEWKIKQRKNTRFSKLWIENWLFQKKIVTPLLRISIFWSWTPWISSQIFRYPLEFSNICIDPPGNPCFSLNFWCTPWNSNNFYSTSLEFSIDILNRGVTIFFWKNPIWRGFSLILRFFLQHLTCIYISSIDTLCVK